MSIETVRRKMKISRQATGREDSAPATKGSGQAVVSVRNLVKRFRREDQTVAAALDGVSFDVHQGEFLVLLGPSGCGKTTLLRTIAGLETPDAGEIAIHGRVCFSAKAREFVPTEDRGISMIFQSYALWPHMSVFDNIAYPLRNVQRRQRKSAGQIKKSVEQVLHLVGIPELIGQYPGQMSGGQQQRVALARALVAGTGLILFDEPLSNVDAKVRDQLRYELVSMQRELGFAAIYVTHDQDEAMSMAHRIAVLGSGKILQIAPPREVYFSATSLDVARFVGKTNELEGTVTGLTGGEVTVATNLGEFVGVASTADMKIGDAVVLNWRPEHTAWHNEVPQEGNRYRGVVQGEVFLGAHVDYHVTVDGRGLLLRQPAEVRLRPGEQIWMSVARHHTRALKKHAESYG